MLAHRSTLRVQVTRGDVLFPDHGPAKVAELVGHQEAESGLINAQPPEKSRMRPAAEAGLRPSIEAAKSSMRPLLVTFFVTSFQTGQNRKYGAAGEATKNRIARFNELRDIAGKLRTESSGHDFKAFRADEDRFRTEDSGHHFDGLLSYRDPENRHFIESLRLAEQEADAYNIYCARKSAVTVGWESCDEVADRYLPDVFEELDSTVTHIWVCDLKQTR